MNFRMLTISAVLASQAMATVGAEPQTGPAVKGYGPVFSVPEGSFNLSNDRHYKVSKDVAKSSEDPAAMNRGLESAARFMNMQARNGTPSDQLEMAVIVHGAAAKDMLKDNAYRERFGVENPNSGLLSALGDAGVRVFLCGQTAAARGIDPDQLNANVSLALSAMAAHVQLQSEGYTLIPF